MIDNIIRDLQVFGKANSLIGRIWLNVMARRFGLFALAGLVAVFGLGMANVAGFYGLQQYWGPVWAAALVAVADVIIALIIVLLARSVRPGPEIELALDVRKMAIEAIQADSRDIKDSVQFTRAANPTDKGYHRRVCSSPFGHRGRAPPHSCCSIDRTRPTLEEGTWLKRQRLRSAARVVRATSYLRPWREP